MKKRVNFKPPTKQAKLLMRTVLVAEIYLMRKKENQNWVKSWEEMKSSKHDEKKLNKIIIIEKIFFLSLLALQKRLPHNKPTPSIAVSFLI